MVEIKIRFHQHKSVGWIVDLASRLLDDLAVLVGELAHDLVVDVLADLAASVLGLVVGFAIATKQCPTLVSLEVVLQDLLVELLVLPIQLWIGEDTSLQQIVAEVRTPTQMLVHIGERRPERLQDHLPVLLSNYLVTYAASRVDVLFPDRSDLGNNLARLGLQNALEHADGVVDQV